MWRDIWTIPLTRSPEQSKTAAAIRKLTTRLERRRSCVVPRQWLLIGQCIVGQHHMVSFLVLSSSKFLKVLGMMRVVEGVDMVRLFNKEASALAAMGRMRTDRLGLSRFLLVALRDQLEEDPLALFVVFIS